MNKIIWMIDWGNGKNQLSDQLEDKKKEIISLLLKWIL
jgi:hypothetical protein